MFYRVMVAGEFKTEIGWDYIPVEYTGVLHESEEKAKAEMWRAEREGFRAWIVEYDEKPSKEV